MFTGVNSFCENFVAYSELNQVTVFFMFPFVKQLCPFFKKSKRLTKKDLKEIVNNSEDSEYSDDSSQNYDSNISPQNISRPISSESRKDEFSDEEQNLICITGHG